MVFGPIFKNENFALRRSRRCEHLQTKVGYFLKGLGWGHPAFWKPNIFPAKKFEFGAKTPI